MTIRRVRYNSLTTLLLSCAIIGLSGCSSPERFAPVDDVPPAALITESDIENLLRISVELRQEVFELRQEVERLKAKH